jgi:hypothetical protein
MDTEQIIKQLDSFQVKLFVRTDGEVLPADPVTLSNNLLLIRGLLIQLVEKVYIAELDYRKTKASRFDRFLKEGMKKSPAFDQLEMEDDLIDKKLGTERLRNYIKYVDGLCTSIQSVLKVQSASEKNQY